MSKIKSPQAKKAKSLALDGRSAFDGSNKGNRKTVPAAKARGHREERRSIGQILSSPDSAVNIDAAEAVESELRHLAKKKDLKRFKKTSDKPLGKVVANKLARAKSDA